jgi:predicted transcriptional regulator
MTRQGLEILLERVSTWPEEAQDEFVKSVADIESKHLGVYRLSDEERDAVRRGLADMREGRLASDAEVAAVFNRYRGRRLAGPRPRSRNSTIFSCIFMNATGQPPSLSQRASRNWQRCWENSRSSDT